MTHVACDHYYYELQYKLYTTTSRSRSVFKFCLQRFRIQTFRIQCHSRRGIVWLCAAPADAPSSFYRVPVGWCVRTTLPRKDTFPFSPPNRSQSGHVADRKKQTVSKYPESARK